MLCVTAHRMNRNQNIFDPDRLLWLVIADTWRFRHGYGFFLPYCSLARDICLLVGQPVINFLWNHIDEHA